MPAPWFLIVIPLALALMAHLLRRWSQIAVAVATGASWLVAIVLRGYDLSPPTSAATWDLFGEALTLTERSQQVLIVVYLLLGVIILLSAVYGQGDKFVALSVVTLSPLSAALMVESFVYGAVLLFLAAGGMAMLIQGSRAGSTLAALRFFSLFALAMPLLLGAGWMIDNDQFRFLDTITLLLLVALLLLTTAFPFQFWVAPIVGESSSLTPSVVYGLGQMVVLVYCLGLLLDQPFVFGSAEFQLVVSLSAAVTLLLAAVLTVTARSFGHQLGYLLLLNIGVVMAVIGSADAAVVEVTAAVVVLRAISLIIAGVGLTMLRIRALSAMGGLNQFEANNGLARRIPLGVGLFVLGCLSLAGLPLTPGFAGTWSAVIAVARHLPWLAAILVLSVAGGAFGVLRRLVPLLIGPAGFPQEQDGRPAAGKGELLLSGLVLGASVIVIVFPRLILTFAANLADLF